MRRQASEDDGEAVELLSTAEAVLLVRRWLEAEGADPEAIFVATGESTLRYKELIPHLTEETEDGRLIRLALSRGRSLRGGRGAGAGGCTAPPPRSAPDPPAGS